MWKIGAIASFGLCGPRKGKKSQVSGPTTPLSVTVEGQICGEVTYIHSSSKFSPSYSGFCALSPVDVHFEESKYFEEEADEDKELDPITLNEIGEFSFSFVAPNGKEVIYNAESIFEYFSKAGVFVDPVTRVEWDADSLSRLEETVRRKDPEAYKAGLTSTLPSKAAEKQQQLRRKQELLSLENCLGELVAEALKIVEGQTHPGLADFNLSLLLSQFEVPFAEMKLLDIEYAFMVWSSWITYLKGPRLRPTENKANILDSALCALKAQWTERDQEAIEALRAESRHCRNGY